MYHPSKKKEKRNVSKRFVKKMSLKKEVINEFPASPFPRLHFRERAAETKPKKSKMLNNDNSKEEGNRKK
jgi:hypothetical protein